MATFLVLAAKFESDEPQKFAVHGGKVTTADLAVAHFKWANRFIGEDEKPQEWFSVKAFSDQPVSLSDVDPLPAPLQKLMGK